ncbi:hypothetical protein WR25_15559 [Diploscapter pachys]|uniref:Uncharacterized protein n=1 Tax=Diploscapter pachys TaxID=2018661 RepID=A0A2A2JWB0_9BILA|nr:hypothetical protein WR25_15559 [Diploscapter pachys]
MHVVADFRVGGLSVVSGGELLQVLLLALLVHAVRQLPHDVIWVVDELFVHDIVPSLRRIIVERGIPEWPYAPAIKVKTPDSHCQRPVPVALRRIAHHYDPRCFFLQLARDDAELMACLHILKGIRFGDSKLVTQGEGRVLGHQGLYCRPIGGGQVAAHSNRDAVALEFANRFQCFRVKCDGVNFARQRGLDFSHACRRRPNAQGVCCLTEADVGFHQVVQIAGQRAATSHGTFT